MFDFCTYIATPLFAVLSLLYLYAWRPHVHFQTNPYYVLSTVVLNDAKVHTMLYLTNFKS